MDDCRSMMTRLLVSYWGIAFYHLKKLLRLQNTIPNEPIVLLAVLSYPLFDLLRVFAIQIKQKRRPLNADSNHIHPRLLRLDLSHKKATLLLVIYNVLVIGFTFLLTDLEIHLQLLMTVITGALLYLSPFLRVFEVDIDLRGSNSIVSSAPIASENITWNDTFEFDFKQMPSLKKRRRGKKERGFPCR